MRTAVPGTLTTIGSASPTKRLNEIALLDLERQLTAEASEACDRLSALDLPEHGAMLLHERDGAVQDFTR
jgi:hypothetical protein